MLRVKGHTRRAFSSARSCLILANSAISAAVSSSSSESSSLQGLHQSPFLVLMGDLLVVVISIVVRLYRAIPSNGLPLLLIPPIRLRVTIILIQIRRLLQNPPSLPSLLISVTTLTAHPILSRMAITILDPQRPIHPRQWRQTSSLPPLLLRNPLRNSQLRPEISLLYI